MPRITVGLLCNSQCWPQRTTVNHTDAIKRERERERERRRINRPREQRTVGEREGEKEGKVPESGHRSR